MPGMVEPALDFYSKRLRELAGTTSPTASPSPRKLTPPFSSPQPGPPSSQPSTPQPPHPSHTPTSSTTASVSAAAAASSRGSESSTPKMKSCEFCGKAFRFQSNLIVHRRSHTGEKPYKCHICNHACTQASKLKRHMKTHLNKSPGSTISENTSVESASSTPDSNGAGAGKRNADGKYNNLEEDGSDAQGSVDTAENDEEEEDDDDDEEELLEEDELGSEAAEDLSTSAKSQHSLSEVSTTPLLGVGGSDGGPIGNGNRERASRDASRDRSHSSGNGNPERLEKQSLLGEVMEKIGLSNIQHYSEAYKQALEENNASRAIKEENRTLSDVLADVHRGPELVTENGLERRLRLQDELGKGIIGPPTLDPGVLAGHGMIGAFDTLFNASKRIKLEMGESARERDSLYAGLWLPGVTAPRDIFMGIPGGGIDSDHLGHTKHSSESALKALGLPDANSPKPGPSGGGANSIGPGGMLGGNGNEIGCGHGHGGHGGHGGRGSGGGGEGRGHHHHHHHHHHSHHGSGNGGSSGGGIPSALGPGLLGVATGNGKPKEQRRNDTCEFCGKVFKNCSNLTVHRRSHTGEKPYKCELCSYACAQSSKLTRHMKTHGRLGKDVYRCRFCDMPFSVPSTLEKHMRKCVVNQNSKTSETDTDSKEAT